MRACVWRQRQRQAQMQTQTLTHNTDNQHRHRHTTHNILAHACRHLQTLPDTYSHAWGRLRRSRRQPCAERLTSKRVSGESERERERETAKRAREESQSEVRQRARETGQEGERKGVKAEEELTAGTRPERLPADGRGVWEDQAAQGEEEEEGGGRRLVHRTGAAQREARRGWQRGRLKQKGRGRRR
eukprot:1793046-Rhodomonas_salina.3